MSSPSRLLRGRPTAPLPTQYTLNSLNSLYKSEVDDIEQSSSPSSSGLKMSSAHSPALCCTSVDVDVVSSEEQVKNYLRFHKSFLEEFILEDVPQETLERVLIRKAQRKDSTAGLEKKNPHGVEKNQSRWKFCVHSDKQELIRNLTESIHDGVPFTSVLLQLCKSVSDAVKANVSELFLVESGALVGTASDTDEADLLSVDICTGGTVEGFVAATQQAVKMNILEERNSEEFPEGSKLIRKSSAVTVASILSIPILQGDGSTLGVLTMGRNASEPPFVSKDEEIINGYLTWAAVALFSAQEHSTCLQQQKLNDAYEKMTKLMLESDGHADCNAALQVISDTVSSILNADRTSFFLMDNEGKNLCAQVFQVNKEEEELVTMGNHQPTCIGYDLEQLRKSVQYKGQNIVFSIDKGVAGYTARTGKLQNVTDAKSCPYFCPEVDKLTGYSTETLLCAPIVGAGRVLGVLEAVNKKGSVFSRADEDSLQSLANLFGLMASYCRVKESLSAVENQLKVSQEILAHHRLCSEDHFTRVKDMSLSTEEQSLALNMSIETTTLSLDVKALLVLTMFKDLVDVNHYGFNQDRLLRFVLTVARNYRMMKYHNWDHAFSVAHCMYWIIKGAPERFSDLERISLFWGCLCHDLDHRGHGNSFLVKTGAPLAKLYSSSVLENHHFSQALELLQLEGHNIFSCLSSEEYKQVLTLMQKVILATDLVLYFGNKDRLSEIVNSGVFSWDVPQHKELVFCLVMTTCDLCSSYKPWEDHLHSVSALCEEFHMQGDEEKVLGMKPLKIMDRDFKHNLPSSQVEFLRSITCPCCELLIPILPQLKSLLHNAKNNIEMWEKLSKETTTDG